MTEPDAAAWRRPHPLSILVRIVTFVGDNAVTVGFLLLAGGAGAGFELVGLALGAVSVLAGVAQWMMTRYAVTDRAVELRTGVFNRQMRAIPLERVQQVTIAEPVVARVFGLASVQVSEASADGDVAISHLAAPEARALAAWIREQSVVAPGGSSTGSADDDRPLPPPTYTIHETRLGDLVKYHLAVSAPGALVGLVAVAVVAGSLLLGRGPLVGAVALIVGLVGVGGLVVSGLVGAILGFGGFALQRGPRGLSVDTGLLSRRHLEVRPDRVQTLTVTSGPLARRVGLHQVVFSAAVGKADSDSAVIHLGPAVRSREVDDLVRRALDLDPDDDDALESVSPLTVRRHLVRAGLLFAVAGVPASVAGALLLHPVVPVLVLTGWICVSVPVARARYRRLGVALSEQRLVVRRGVLVHSLTRLSPRNVQSVVVRSSWFQRRLGVCDLVVTTAGIGPHNAVRVPDLEVHRAERIAYRLATVAADTSWELAA